MVKRLDNAPLISDKFNEFINSKRALGIRQPTLDNYDTSLRVFLTATGLGVDNSVSTLTKALVEGYSRAEMEGGTAPSTVAHYLRDIRVFIYWLQEQDLIPTYKIKLPKITTDKLKRYDESDLKKLLSLPDKADEYWVWRCWLVCNLMLGTGARIGSLCSLKKTDITGTTITFTHTKNGKQLTVPLPNSLKSAIQRYLATWQIDSDYLLISSKLGRQLDPHVAVHSFDKFATSRGVSSLGLHAFRHTYSYMLYKNGVDIVSLQTLLGHSSIEMTRHYIGQLTEVDLPTYNNPLDNLITTKTTKLKRR